MDIESVMDELCIRGLRWPVEVINIVGSGLPDEIIQFKNRFIHSFYIYFRH